MGGASARHAVVTALVYCPFPDRESAETIARQLLDERLVACVNLGPSVLSAFVWEGDAGSAEETPALFKTDARCLQAAMKRLEDLHPYDTPAIMGWPCDASASTRAWLGGLVEGVDHEAE